MSVEEEMNAALDDIEKDNDVNLDEPLVKQEEQGELEIEAKPEEKPVEAAPKGYISYEDWIAAGRDPDDFKGKNAYSAEYDRLKEIRGLKSSINAIGQGVEEWKQQQNEQTRVSIEQAKIDTTKDLEAAKKNDDIEAALAASAKLNTLENAPPQVNTPPPPMPVLTEFFENNPILDQNSALYDQEFFTDMAMIQQTILQKLTGGDPNRMAAMSEAQIKRTMTAAYKDTKELHPDKFVSKRNTRGTTPSNKGKKGSGGKVDYESKLRSLPGNARNPRDATPTQDLYNFLKKTDPKAADDYAKSMLGDG